MKKTQIQFIFCGIKMENKGHILRKIETAHNRKLKLVLKDGKKLLNTKNTNYSYGSLVKVLEYGLDRIPFTGISSILLLGMGGGSIIKSLRKKYNCQAPITAVEIDQVVINIARNEFGIAANDKLKIHCMDAWDFVTQCNAQFDLIIVDIFIDLHVPSKFYKTEFWKMLGKNLNKNAFILFNAGIDMSEEEVQEFVDDLPEKYIYQKNFYILKTNTLIIMQKIV